MIEFTMVNSKEKTNQEQNIYNCEDEGHYLDSHKQLFYR